jgi:hypothetical protein
MGEGTTEVIIDMTDLTFSDSNDEISGKHSLTSLEWGIGADCRYGSRYESQYKLNLEGTPFKLQDSQPRHGSAGGYLPHGSASCEEGQQICSGQCGGYCGYCGFGHAGQVKRVTLVVADQKAFDAVRCSGFLTGLCAPEGPWIP